MSEELSREETHQALDCAVEELLASAGVQEPPVDAVVIARDHLRLEPGAARRGRRPVALRPDASPEQRQLLAALQIAEQCKGDLLARLGIDPEAGRPLLGESLTSRFAERLLVPTRWLADLARSSGFDLFLLKEHFTTASHEMIAWRLLDLDEPCVVTLVENDHVSRRRGNAWSVNKTLCAAERECQRQVHRYSRPCRVSDDEWDVRGWPLHAPDFTREVLLSRRA